MPAMPSPVSASRTSSSLNGLMIARISFMMPPFANGTMSRCNSRAKLREGGRQRYFMRKFCQAKYESFANWAETQRICLNFRHALAGAPEPCPYRQMVRGARGKRALVYPGLHRFKIGRGKDTVEFCDGAAAVKAVPGVDEPMMLGEIGKAAPAI